MAPGDNKNRKNKKSISALKMVLPYVMPYKLQLIGAAIALLFAAATVLAMGAGLRFLIDEGFAEGDPLLLDRAVIVLVVVVILLAGASYARFYLISWVGERVVADLRVAVFNHVIGLNLAFFETRSPGEILSRISTDTTLVQTVVGSSVSVALRNLLLFVGGMILLLITSPKLTGLVLLVTPFVLVPIIVLGRGVRTLSRYSQDRVADIGTYAGEIVQNIKVVQSFTREPEESKAFSIEVEKAFTAAKQRIMQSSLLIAAAMILVFTGLGAMIWTGGRDVTSGIITAGELAAFVFYAIMVARSVAVISEIYGQLQRAAGATERLIELLTEESQIIAPANPKKLSKGPLSLSFQNVSFSYPSRAEQYAIEDISFDINAGETVAIVGLSGAGKTTIFELFQRFYDPTNGSIKIDDINIVDLDPNDLRSSIGHVPQQPTLFSADVTHNIAYGKPLATENEINNAATKAYALEFIDQLPDGFKSYLGEQGVRLSGGQRQRIAIARAMLKDPSILLLDEATSALDASSEQKVQAALKDLMQGRTTLIIAHRLATIMHADRILLIDQGKLIAQGNHKGLLDSSELYKQLCELQFNH